MIASLAISEGWIGERAEGQPVAVAVDLEAEAGLGEREQHHRRPAAPARPAARSSRCGSRLASQAHGQADQHPGQLLEEDVVAAVVDPVGVDARGAQHHHQADGEQQRGRAEQQVVRRQRPVERVARRAATSRPATGRGVAAAGGWSQRPPRRSRSCPPLAGRVRLGRLDPPQPAHRLGEGVAACAVVRRTCPWRRIPGPAARCRRAGPARGRRPRPRGPWVHLRAVSPPSTSITRHIGRVSRKRVRDHRAVPAEQYDAAQPVAHRLRPGRRSAAPLASPPATHTTGS